MHTILRRSGNALMSLAVVLAYALGVGLYVAGVLRLDDRSLFEVRALLWLALALPCCIALAGLLLLPLQLLGALLLRLGRAVTAPANSVTHGAPPPAPPV